MFESRAEIAGWVIAVLIVAGMGALVAHGAFHNVNKTHAAPPGKPTLILIQSDPKDQGKYVPQTATVHVGQLVQWKNVSDAAHTVSAPGLSSGDLPNGGQMFSFIPKKPGTYKYKCVYHPLMRGILIVKA